MVCGWQSGGIGQTSTNYTGQRLDGSGLLYYHARYYDPALARFVSADSVVPGSASGSMDGVALKSLTVDFHEPGFATTLAGENAQPFQFQLNGEQRQQAGSPWGPLNPQALNRYSYVLNNPVKYTDPSGHQGVDETAPVDLGNGYRARVDKFTGKNVTRYEIHVYKASGGKLTEVGVYGQDGWINRHGHKGQTGANGLPKESFDKLNGMNIAEARKRGIIKPKGEQNIRGYQHLPESQRPRWPKGGGYRGGGGFDGGSRGGAPRGGGGGGGLTRYMK